MIKNPAFIYCVSWLVVLLLYELHYALVLIPLTDFTIYYLLLTMLFWLLPFYVMLAAAKEQGLKYQSVRSFSPNFSSRYLLVFKIWTIGTIVELLYFHSSPLLSIFIGGGVRYTEWGIPSVHGFLNAIIISVSNINFYKYLETRNSKYLKRFFMCLFWPLFLLTRQMLMSMILQAALIYFFKNKIKFTSLLRYAVVAMIVIYTFGALGDVRSGEGAIENIAQISDDYPDWLPGGFMWIYIYITSPLNNLNYNIDNAPLFAFDLSSVLSGLFPSFLRAYIFEKTTTISLVTESLNVSSMHPKYISSFGVIGSLISYFLLSIIYAYFFMKYRLKSNVKWLFVTVVVTHNLILSVFSDFNLNLVFIFQIVVHYWMGGKIKTVQ